MIVHVYALCWNEEKMLPYFFRHYDNIADRYYIFDNGSTDNSLSILRAHPKVIVDKFTIQGNSFVKSAQKTYDHFWKQSRGIADWVIVCNLDEHLYHPNLRKYLQHCSSHGITMIVPEGYEMVSNRFPKADKRLCKRITYGVRKKRFDKPQIFNPREIEEINFAAGRHTASPAGNVVMPSTRKVLLLHYKYIGLKYLSSRYEEQKTRLRKTDIANRWGSEYLWEESKKAREFEKLKRAAVKVL
ncbi:glycosyltransferase family 2 protein [Cohnella cholangitidis]|uniref:Glycosyltransferase family 2 protein n=1 Tax=Cohnella cholangitidis TaxID=2598458 RepID=A0A7G5BV13_9BACL|nr:glycosyltransferase family 2 protein [Cohnella cholangitidis]QMV40797.1 glycosyltransferase family 2 protein [Cohnella cholangitidis]